MEAGRRSADALGVVGLRSGDGYDVGIFPAASRQNGSFTDLRLNAGGAYVRRQSKLGAIGSDLPWRLEPLAFRDLR